MPNHCENDLYIFGPNREAIRDQLRSTEGEPTPLTFRKIVPRPEILDHTISGSQTEESLKIQKQAIAETGYISWYEWSLAKWGTKWDAYRVTLSESQKRLKYKFETAWSPPEPVILALSKMFPKNKIKLCFFERGMAYQGRRVYLAGELIETWDGEYHGNRGG